MRRSRRSTTKRPAAASRSFSPREPFHEHEVGSGAAPPDVGEGLVLLALVPELRLLEAVELDEDEPLRRPASLQHLDPPAANAERAAIALDHLRDAFRVFREALGIFDGHVSNQVCRHGYS